MKDKIRYYRALTTHFAVLYSERGKDRVREALNKRTVKGKN